MDTERAAILRFMPSILRSPARIAEGALLLFCLFTILWHGGKTLESTWILGILAGGIGAFYWWTHTAPLRPARKTLADLSIVRRAHGLLWWTLMLFVGWTITSFVFSTTRNYGLDEVLRDASFAVLFFWMIRREEVLPATAGVPALQTRRMSFASKLFRVITIGAVLACFVGIAVYVFQPVNRFVGTFVDPRFATDYWPNAWADFLLLAWPCVYACAKHLRLRWHAPLLGLVIGCLFLSYSRGALIALGGQLAILGIVLTGAALLRARQKGARAIHLHVRALRRRILLAAAALTAAVALFLAVNAARSPYHAVESLGAKATFTAAEGSSSVTERSDFWHQSYALSLQRPLFGWGPYSFRFVQPRLQQNVFETSDHPHNLFLKLAMERGWPAAFLLAFFLLFILASTAWAVAKRRSIPASDILPDRDADLLLPAFLGIGGVLLHSQIDYNLQFVGIALPFWLLLGFLASRLSASRLMGCEPRFIRIAELVLIAALLVTLFFEGRALVLSSLGRRAEGRYQALVAAERGTEASPFLAEALHWYDLARGEIFSRDMHLSRAALLLGDGEAPAAARAIDEYLAQNAQDARAWKLKGDTEYRRGDYAKALQSYDRASQLGKYDYLGILTGTLQTLLVRKDAKEAAARKGGTDIVLHAFDDAIQRDAHFIDLSTNVEEFAEAAGLAAKLYPADADRYAALADKVTKKAVTERTKLGGERQGMLW